MDVTISWISLFPGFVHPPGKCHILGLLDFPNPRTVPYFWGLGHPDVIMYVVVVLGPIPSGYDPDDGSEEEVKVQARNRNDHTNTLLQPSHARGSQTPHVIARLKQHLPGMSRVKGLKHAKHMGIKLHNKEGRKRRATLGVIFEE